MYHGSDTAVFLRAAHTVAQQTRELAEVNRLNKGISDKERKISQLFLMMGQSYFERHKNDDTAEELERIEEIKALNAEILVNREKIKQIKGVVKCASCGADVPLNAAFCNACGAKVNRAEHMTDNSEEVCICPNCQAVVEKGNLFCSRCGAKTEYTNE